MYNFFHQARELFKCGIFGHFAFLKALENSISDRRAAEPLKPPSVMP
jgi:hypothetical protein